jgi:hypothetical protein
MTRAKGVIFVSYDTVESDMAVVHARAFLANVAAPTEEQRAKTVRCLAAHATSAQELSEWLEMLGLSATEGKSAR